MAGNTGREGRLLFVGKPWALQLALVAVVALSGCSSVPKAVNPVEWAKSVGNVFSGDDEKEAQAPAGQAIPGEKGAFPKLGNTPDPEAARARRPQAKGLVGDTSSQYAEPVARQGAPTSPLSAAPEVKTPAVPVKPAGSDPARAPEPPAAPVAPAPAVAAPAPAAPPPGSAAPSPPMAASAPEAPNIAAVPDAARRVSAPPQPGAAQAAVPAPVQPAAQARPAAPAYPAADQTVVVSGDGITFESGRQRSMAGYAAATPARGTGGESGIPSADGVLTEGLTRIATIQFGDGSAVLDPSDQKVLRDVAAIVKERGGRHVLVIGHASSRTSDMEPVRHAATNYEISARRADTVAKALAGFGVKRDIIDARAAADQQPTYYESMPAGEAGNRRTEIYVGF